MLHNVTMSHKQIWPNKIPPQVVASVFHFHIVNTPLASISTYFRIFSARQLSEITIVQGVYCTSSGIRNRDLIVRSRGCIPLGQLDASFQQMYVIC